MAPIDIQRIDHVVIRVANLDRALGFYCDVLGCREERRVESLGLVQLRAGASLIDLIEIEGKPPEGAPNMDHFALRLGKFDAKAITAHLSNHGINAGEVVNRYGAEGTGPSIYITDPDGNTVELKGPPEG